MQITFSVISVTTWSAILSSKDAQRDKLESGGYFSRRPSGQRTRSGLFIKILLFVGVCIGVVYGYKAYILRARFGGYFGSGGTSMFGGFGDGYGYNNQRRL